MIDALRSRVGQEITLDVIGGEALSGLLVSVGQTPDGTPFGIVVKVRRIIRVIPWTSIIQIRWDNEEES